MPFLAEHRMLEKFQRENDIRVTPAYVESLRRWITKRDMEILRLLFDYPYLTSEQISMIVFGSLSPSSRLNKANERIRRLYHAHCLDRFFPPVQRDCGSSQQHLVLDKAGAMLIAPSLTEAKDREKMAKFKKRAYVTQDYKHLMKILDFKAILHLLNHQLGCGEIIQFKVENEAVMKYKMATRGRNGETHEKSGEVEPDSRIAYKYNEEGRVKIFFLECDNATESEAQLKTKIKRYNACYRYGAWRQEAWARIFNTFPPVVFLMHSEDKCRKLLSYIRSLRSEVTFLICTYNKLLDQEFKVYESTGGKRREVLQRVNVKLLESIFISNKTEGLTSL